MRRPLLVAPILALHLVAAARLAAQAVTVGSPGDSARIAAALAPRTLVAARLSGPAPAIDGRLDEPIWHQAATATDFVQANPRPGALPTQSTVARVAFDDDALYVAVRAYDPHPDSIVAPYPRRDDETTSDWIFVEIDSRHDRRTAFSLGVNPRGVQVDGTFTNDIVYDASWDGVWQAAARIDSAGWSAEYRIPFSQLAYSPPNAGAGRDATIAMGLNVYRAVARTGESSDWSPRLPTVFGVVSRFNDLVGIVPPSAPARLQIVPYSALTAAATPVAPGDPLTDATTAKPSAGADLRFRITPSFALTAAIHPDFGQVEADPSLVNLTTFETFLPEKRPLFIEGAEIFRFDLGLPFHTRENDFSVEQPFYSRRIGRPPHGGAPERSSFADIPVSSTLLGAAKLSGRTSRGLSMGVLGALTASEDARFLDSLGRRQRLRVEPRTAYGVARIVKDFNDNRSAVGAIATMVDRGRLGPALAGVLPARASSVGADGRSRFGGGNYELSGFAIGSRVEGTPSAITSMLHGPGHFFQRPDAEYLHDDTTRTSANGLSARARVAKIAGAWRWDVTASAISPGFEVNDVGFQRNADWLLAVASGSYQRYQPGHFIRRWQVGTDQLGLGWTFGGERRAAVANMNLHVDLRNYWGGSLSVDHEFTSLATEALRGGPALLMPPRNTLTAQIFSDSRRPLQVLIGGTAFTESETQSHSVDFTPAFTWRAIDRLALSFGPGYTRSVNGWQYVDQATAAGTSHYIFGRLDETTMSLSSHIDYAFSSTLTLQLYAQPFVSAGRYHTFREVRAPRAARPDDRLVAYRANQISYDASAAAYGVDVDGNGAPDLTFPDPNFNQKDFNANTVLRWEYRPGSTLYVVWSQERHRTIGDGSFALGRDARRLFAVAPTNVLLVKASYWFSM